MRSTGRESRDAPAAVVVGVPNAAACRGDAAHAQPRTYIIDKPHQGVAGPGCTLLQALRQVLARRSLEQLGGSASNSGGAHAVVSSERMASGQRMPTMPVLHAQRPTANSSAEWQHILPTPMMRSGGGATGRAAVVLSPRFLARAAPATMRLLG